MSNARTNPCLTALSELLAPASPPWTMGILNCTPDSFSDGSSVETTSDAIQKGHTLLAQGAHILDIGGEATGPNSKPVSAAKELERIFDVIKYFAPKTIVSIDTYKSGTARKCLEAGAHIINDVSGLRADKELPFVIKEFGAFIVIMHSKEPGPLPHVTTYVKEYSDVIEDIALFFRKQLESALNAGISEDRIILDPGMGGFLSSNPNVSWELLERLQELTETFAKFPFLIGTSRKGFLGGAISERDEKSKETALIATRKGASIIRTHLPHTFT